MKRIIRVSTQTVNGIEGTLIEKLETKDWETVKFIPNGNYVELDRTLGRYRLFGWDFEYIDY